MPTHHPHLDIIRDLNSQICHLFHEDDDAFAAQDYARCREIREEIFELRTMIKLYEGVAS